MPHVVLEYSANIEEKPDFSQVLSEIHELLPSVGPYEPSGIKSRAVERSTFRVAQAESGHGFVHVELAILSGRDEGVRRETSARLLELLKRQFEKSLSKQRISFSVEIREIDGACYSKETCG